MGSGLIFFLHCIILSVNVLLLQDVAFRYYNADGNRGPVLTDRRGDLVFIVGPQEKTDGKTTTLLQPVTWIIEEKIQPKIKKKKKLGER